MKPPKVFNNNGHCCIRYTHRGVRESLTLGMYDSAQDRFKMERIALEIAEAINDGTYTSIEQWKPKIVKINKASIIEEIRNNLIDGNLPSVLRHLESYEHEIRNSTEAQRFIESLSIGKGTKTRYLTAIRRIESLRDTFTIAITGNSTPSKGIDPFTTSEIDKLKQVCSGIHYEPYILFILYTGCRPSEAIGLRWCDVELENKRIHFNRSLARNQLGKGRIEKGTKTGKTRFTPISGNLIGILLDLRYALGEVVVNGDSLVFLTPEGSVIDDRNFCNRMWKPLLVSAGIRYRAPYNLRHTFISHCLAQGVDVVTVASWVGNSPEIIFKHYAGLVNDRSIPDF